MDVIHKILKVVLSIIGYLYSIIKPIIVFESVPDYSDNTLAVYNEMIKRGMNKKYTLVWLCKNKWDYDNNENVIFVTSTFWKYIYSYSAKCVICCNKFLPSHHIRQKSLYLTHGEPIKRLKDYYAPQNIDYVIGLSSQLNKVMAKELRLPEHKFYVTGFPRNDNLFNPNNKRNVRKLFGGKYYKIIMWLPTFRQHKKHDVDKCTSSPLPVIHNKEAAIGINDFLRKTNILIILKPHFAQDLSYIQDNHLSNLLFIDDSFFKENNINLYELLGGCDALITDYSSVYYDYLLCNKPIAVMWEDIEEYQKNRGFALDVNYYTKGAYKIYKFEDFKSFLEKIGKGEDPLKEQRYKINQIVNQHQDAYSAKRVVDFVEDNCL